MENNNKIQIQFVPIELLEYNNGQIPGVPENPRTREDAKQKNLEKSIEELPEMTIARAALCFPYNGHYVVIGGNRRLEAQRALKRKEVPIIALPKDTPVDKLRRIALIDNESTGQTDWTKLAKEWNKDEIREWNIETPKGWFNEAPGKKAEEDNYTEPEKLKPRVKPGEIWQLGEHRLMCGDSTKKDDVVRLMNGSIADLLLTDPPYGIEAVSSNKQVDGGGELKFKGKIGGNKPFGDTKGKVIKANKYIPIKGDDTIETAMLNYEIVKDLSRQQIIFGGNYFTEFLFPSSCWIIWDKQNTGNFADVEMAWTSFKKGAKLYSWLWNGLCRKGDRKTEGKTRVHPTQKPVGLIENIISDFSEENQIILDCFGGSGSTLIACEQTNRVCYMLEFESYYCDVIINRWETLTGRKAVKIE